MKKFSFLFITLILLFSLRAFPVNIEDRIKINVNWEITHIDEINEPDRYFAIKKGEEVRGYAILSEDYSRTMGYGGPINLLIIMDREYYIQTVEIVSHSETQEFLDMLYDEGFFEQFKGRKINEILSGTVRIDTVSGATVTADAIMDIVNDSLSSFSKIELKKREGAKIKIDYMFVIALVFCVLISLVAFKLKNQIVRLIVLGINFVILTVISFEILSFRSFYSLYIFNTTNLNNILLLILSLVFVIIMGRLYCGYMCPFTFIFELLYRVKKTRLKMSRKLDSYLKKIRYVVLFSLILGFAITGNSNFFISQPFASLNIFLARINLVRILVIVIIGLFVPFFWCKYFCPVGAVFGILSFITVFKKKIKCKGTPCRRWEHVCPYTAIRNLKVSQPECVLCQRCKCIKQKNEGRSMQKHEEGRFLR